MKISTEIKKYIFQNENHNYILYNYDYFSTDYIIKSDYTIDEIKEYTSMIKLINKLSKDKLIIDIGANCGLFCIPASLSGYKVLAFEPIKMNVELLSMNKNENKCDTLEIIPMALFNETKKETIYIPYCSDNTSFNKDIAISNMKQKDYVEEVVDCIKFDEWLNENPHENIGFIKIDVQGFEKNVLDGMVNFLSNCNDVRIFLEWDEKHTKSAGNSLEDIESLLSNMGFELESTFKYDKLFYKNRK